MLHDLLTFHCANDCFALPIDVVREIRGWQKTRKVPDAPPHLLGLVMLRDNSMPVLDLGRRLGLGATKVEATTVVIVVQQGQGPALGLVVDAVADVLQVSEGDLKPAPQMGQCLAQGAVKGVLGRGDEMLLLLDVEHLFDFDEIFSLVDSAFSKEESHSCP
ncbi:chemotaxis protein CheW [Gallaecimonas xiamenensis]|uniref:Chemotaxis protein CheW n=1 Tax=Gallaecimonas xiamenensis 3-C-1 TaxID=745411 RepID=K2J7F1_9GAMM|nr:chemotaxis protein CheW [Gallaecimonas xiamenensis]EKE71048.1 Positive regulator of CheA protein activity (CheW) [Gallaecimonas xiamenensis 3-C-1]